MMETYNVLILIFVLVVAAVGFIWFIRPNKKTQPRHPIIIVEDSDDADQSPRMDLHTAARLIRAEHFGGTVEDTLQHEYVEELDDILTSDALANGEKLYLNWVMANPTHVAEIQIFVDLENWNLIRAMLEEDIPDTIDVDSVIIFLKNRSANALKFA